MLNTTISNIRNYGYVPNASVDHEKKVWDDHQHILQQHTKTLPEINLLQQLQFEYVLNHTSYFLVMQQITLIN